ncbi:MAG: hypothetical protein GDA45_06595 [Chromatiales bacterium]|nr:hypothetical protein [Chromatiales bacterium]
MKQENDKYLYFPYFKLGGLDSAIDSLEFIINTAVFLGRIPIINKMATTSPHRLDDVKKHAPIIWDKYINLSAAKVLQVEHGVITEMPTPLRYVYEQDFDFDLYTKDQVKYVSREHIGERFWPYKVF